jgi:hypothetical protein
LIFNDLGLGLLFFRLGQLLVDIDVLFFGEFEFLLSVEQILLFLVHGILRLFELLLFFVIVVVGQSLRLSLLFLRLLEFRLGLVNLVFGVLHLLRDLVFD